MRTVLKSGWFWLFLWLIFFGLMILCPVGHAKLKTFRMDNNRNWTTNPADPAIEAPRFDFLFWNKDDSALASTYKSYNPDIRIIQYMLMLTWIKGGEDWDTLQAWCTRNSKDIEDMLIHLKYNYLYASFEPLACPEMPNPQLIVGWDSLNDVDLDSTRDWTAICTLSTRHGTTYIVDTFANWTNNEWVGYGLYNYYGGKSGIIAGNSSDSIWWSFIGDTSNIQTNPGFETGNFTGFDTSRSPSCGDSGAVFSIVTDTVHSGSYAAKLKHLCGTTNQGSYIIATVESPYTYTDYTLNFFYKTTDTLKVQALAFPGGIQLYDSYAETLDGYWRYFSHTFDNTSGDDSILIYIGFQTSYKGYYNDSVWLDDFEIISRYGLLTSSEEYSTYYPYIIDDTLAVDHRASAMNREQARFRAYSWCLTGYGQPLANRKYDVNIGNPDFVNFWVNYWLPYYISKYSFYNGFMVDNVDDHIPNSSSWMTFNEYTSAEDTAFKNDLYIIFSEGRDTCANHDMILTSNTIPPHDSGYARNINGLLDEGAFSPYRFKASNWSEWRNNTQLGYGYNRDEGWEKFIDVDTAGCRQFVMEGYHAYIDGTDTNGMEITALVHYYCVMTDSSYFNFGSDFVNSQWLDIMDFDLGIPLDTCFAETTGTDENGHDFLVVRRDFTNGIVLFKPMWSGVYSMYSYNPDSTITRVYLPTDTVWVQVKANGSSEGAPTYIDLCYNQGAILIRLSCE